MAFSSVGAWQLDRGHWGAGATSGKIYSLVKLCNQMPKAQCGPCRVTGRSLHPPNEHPVSLTSLHVPVFLSWVQGAWVMRCAPRGQGA